MDEVQLKKLEFSLHLLCQDLISKEIEISQQNVIPTPLKTIEKIGEQQKAYVNLKYKHMRTDATRGIQLFIEKATATKKEKLNSLFYHILEEMSADNAIENLQEHLKTKLPEEDLQFLEDLAKKALQSGDCEEAGCMYRCIIYLEASYCPAWVGYLISEQECGRLDLAETICETMLEAFPNDSWVQFYAGQFYLVMNQKDKAKDILQRARDNSKKNENLHTRINELLIAS